MVYVHYIFMISIHRQVCLKGPLLPALLKFKQE